MKCRKLLQTVSRHYKRQIKRLIMKLSYKVTLFIALLLGSMNVLSQNFHLKNILKTRPGLKMNVPVKTNKHLETYSNDYDFNIKNRIQGWTVIYVSPENLVDLLDQKIISECQINFEPGQVLNDTARVMAKGDSVYLGAAPLTSSYKGNGTIVGVIDTGIDFNHPDLQNADGSTRVLHYWDQTLIDTNSLFDPNRISAYGYGQIWDSTDMNAGNCLSIDNHLHGTHVTGSAAGNGLGNGQNMGMAPEANIVMVESDFNHPNWSISVAEACDYIFHIADSLNMPASINISLGSYLGSHDGDDIATEMMEAMLDEKAGRLITCAVGNSGVWGNYHCGADVDSDTSFVWFKTNNSSAFGGPACYFDMWTDTNDFNQVSFAFGADEPSTFDFRGISPFYNIQDVLSGNYTDSIMTLAGDKIGTFEIQASIVGATYHFEFLMQNPDSSNYNFRFMTTGSGHYDLWADDYFGISNLVSSGLPTAIQMPDIIHYNMPDSLQTIISAWASSEKIISVGYSRGQLTYLDVNNIEQSKADVPPGHLSLRSSKGPSRKGVLKPDVVAAGASIMSCGPISHGPLEDLPGMNSTLIAQGGLHLRYSGSSMSSPLVAGIGALYFEVCPNANWEDFKTDLNESATSDAVTGVTPNFAWGNGRANAFRTVLAAEANMPTSPIISYNGIHLSTTSGSQYQWFFNDELIIGANNSTHIPEETGIYTCQVSNPGSCKLASNIIYVNVVGIDEESLNLFELYPNPTNGDLTIVSSGEFGQMEIIDLNGKLINSYRLNGNTEALFNVAYLESGIYTVKLISEEKTVYRKLIKNK